MSPPANLKFEQAFKNIDDVLWKDAGCTSELDYTEQTSWQEGQTITKPADILNEPLVLEFLGLHESHCYSESDLGMGQGGASMNAALDAESAAVLETIKGRLA